MKLLAALSFLVLSSCGAKHVAAPADLPPPTVLIPDTVVIPVSCSEVVNIVDTDMDGATTDQKLEEKVYRLTRSDAQNKIALNVLESAAVKCGVKVTHTHAN